MTRKLFVAALTVIMTMTSCVVRDSSGYMRTSRNIANLTGEIVDMSIVSSVEALDRMASGSSDASMETMDITPDGPDAWIVKSVSDRMEFSFRAIRVPDDIDGFSNWTCTGFRCTYRDGEAYKVEIEAEGTISFDWSWEYGVPNSYYRLVQNGAYRSEFMRDGQVLDWCEMVYVDGTVRYRTSQGM